MTDRGTFNRLQVQQLLKPVNPSRVVTGPHVKPHLSQQDVVAHLSRVFGFGHFDVEVREAECIYEEATTNSKNNAAWAVGYRALVRLTVRDENQREVAHYDGGSTGESDGQPSRAASHDLAFKSALSTATKRAAIHLGDQFGLSLYNKGQMLPLVKGTMVGTDERVEDVQEGVEQQEEDGGLAADRQAADEAAEGSQEPADRPAAAKRATTGRQGTRRKAAPVDKPEPVATPPEVTVEDAVTTEGGQVSATIAVADKAEPVEDPQAMAAEQAEREERARIAAEQEEAQRAKDAEAEAAERRAKREADVARNQERLRNLAAAEPKVENTARPYVDTADGQTYATEAELVEAQRARVQAKREERAAELGTTDAALTEAAKPEPEPQGDEFAAVVEMAPEDYMQQTAAASTVAQVRDVWDRATAAQAMTTELRLAIVKRKARLEAPVDATEPRED